jgi:hypothetical protein
MGFCYLGVLEDEGIGVIVPNEELKVKIDGLLPGENIAQLLNTILKLLLLCNTINQINLHMFESGSHFLALVDPGSALESRICTVFTLVNFLC